MQRTLTACLLLPLLLLCACQRQPPQETRQYSLRGEIIRLDPQARAATIKHEKIDGWMEAMTMDFPVKDEAEFQKLKAGDHITATVFVTGMEYHIGNIQIQQ